MGNYRFKLSDMIPNAWFYKLKDMGKGRTNNKNTTFSKKKNQTPSSTTTTNTTQSPKPKQPHQNQNQCTPRKSYYFTRELINNNNNNNNNNNQNTNKIHHTSPPRKSSPKQQQRQKRRKRRAAAAAATTTTPPRVSISSPKLVSSSVVSSSGCSCRTTLESVWTKSTDSPPEESSSSSSPSSSPFDDDDDESPEPEFIRTDCVLPIESSSSTTFDEMLSLSTNTNNTDIVIDVDKNSLATRRKDDKLDGYDSFSDLDLPPILTKPTTKEEEPTKIKGSLKVKIVKEQSKQRKEQSKQSKEQSKQRNNNNNTNATSIRGFSVSSPGLKLKINSPKLGRKVFQPAAPGRRSVSSATRSSSCGQRSLSGSFAVVKSSFNPMKDFKESMVEMIVENNIRESKDLEDLLACYLSLNSDEYHEVIITVFKQIWFDLTQTR